MTEAKILSKRVQINKSQATIVGVIATAVFIAVFSLVSSKALLTQSNYQLRVIDKKEQARDTINKNLESVGALAKSYQEFTSTPTNMLEGNPAGTGEKDGDNARLVLDALPSKYDFPALTSSLEKIIADQKLKPQGITGTDDEVAQSTVEQTDTPSSVDIPFTIKVKGALSNIQGLVTTFEKSIRPFSFQKFTLSGGADDIEATFEIKTYYQPEKVLKIKLEEVK